MRAMTGWRFQKTTWYVCPWASVRASAISLICVAFAAVIFDRWILVRLERQGLVAADNWQQHNRVVVANHERKDRTVACPGPQAAVGRGVRNWQGHPVTKERTRPHRLLVMGDSFVWGSPYLTLNHMWWRQLEIELTRRGYHDVEVVAAGASGMSTHEQLDLARCVIPDFRPDLILWGYVDNDPDERLVKQISMTQLDSPIPGRIRTILQPAIPGLLNLFDTRRNEKLARCYLGPEYGYEYHDWLRRIYEGDNFAHYRRTVLAVKEFLSEVSTPGLLVTLPNSPSVEYFSHFYDKVLPLWRESGISVQDNLPAFASRFPGTQATGPDAVAWGINPADGHPGPRATAFHAAQTADRLERDYPQFLGTKSRPVANGAIINDWMPYDLDVQPVGLRGQAQAETAFELRYPVTDELMPTMPLDVPTVLVGLQQPLPLQAIHLQGTGLKSAAIWLSTYDSIEHYDTQEWRSLGSMSGSSLTWQLPSDLVVLEASVILLRAEVQPHDRLLKLQFIPVSNVATSVQGMTP